MLDFIFTISDYLICGYDYVIVHILHLKDAPVIDLVTSFKRNNVGTCTHDIDYRYYLKPNGTQTEVSAAIFNYYQDTDIFNSVKYHNRWCITDITTQTPWDPMEPILDYTQPEHSYKSNSVMSLVSRAGSSISDLPYYKKSYYVIDRAFFPRSTAL